LINVGIVLIALLEYLFPIDGAIMELYTEIEIQATADRVWQHLTDLDWRRQLMIPGLLDSEHSFTIKRNS
jgi:hypothetical protein